IQLPVEAPIEIDPIDVSNGSMNCPSVDLSLDNTTFNCSHLGENTVTLTAEAEGTTSTCQATVTVIQLDSDGDGTADCSDDCPLDPDKTAPGICGCGEVDIDTNNNGICDATEFPPNVKLGIVLAD